MSPRADISEFSYGYALIEELALQHGAYITAAPVLPSLKEEGKSGVGYDARLEMLGIPAFLQFKVAQKMTSRRAKECRPPNNWSPPFYRMELRDSRYSDQHESLVSLEAKGHLVYYVAPAFHTPPELNAAYLDGQIAERSFWLRPNAVVLSGDGLHSVGFESPSGRHCVCSEPVAFETNGTFPGFVNSVREALAKRPDANLTTMLTALGDDLAESISRRPESGVRGRHKRRQPRSESDFDTGYFAAERHGELIPTTEPMRSGEPPAAASGLLDLQRLRVELDPLQRAAYLTRTFFDSELIIVGPTLNAT